MMMNSHQFQQKIVPLSDKLYRLALRLLGHDAEAQDVVQEVMIKVWKEQAQWPNINNMEAWCMQLTKNRALDLLRSARRRTAEPVPVDLYTLRDESLNPMYLMEQSDLEERIAALMQQLPEKFRLVLHLRDAESMSYEEIGTALDMPLPQVKINLHRARAQLRHLYMQFAQHEL